MKTASWIGDDDDEDVPAEELVVAAGHALVEPHLEREVPGERDEQAVGGHLPHPVPARQPHAPLPFRQPS